MVTDRFHKQVESDYNTSVAVTLSNVPESIDVTKMNDQQIHAKIQKGYESYETGRIQNAAEAFDNFRKSIG